VPESGYRGRLAPSPTGLLHLGHARTFATAARRACEQGGTLILRNEDLDPGRCRAEFIDAMLEDLRWLGLDWREGPDCGGPFAPYSQSQRGAFYRDAWRTLRDRGFLYPCSCSRKELSEVATAPNGTDDEPVYPGRCRSRTDASAFQDTTGVNWRFRVPDGENICFNDLRLGRQQFQAGRDFGDFVVWRRDDVPAYQLAVVVDDARMAISEVVRGADLLKSTARQILLFRALSFAIPEFYHCELVRDSNEVRISKRHDALSIRRLRALGYTPHQVFEDSAVNR